METKIWDYAEFLKTYNPEIYDDDYNIIPPSTGNVDYTEKWMQKFASYDADPGSKHVIDLLCEELKRDGKFRENITVYEDGCDEERVKNGTCDGTCCPACFGEGYYRLAAYHLAGISQIPVDHYQPGEYPPYDENATHLSAAYTFDERISEDDYDMLLSLASFPLNRNVWLTPTVIGAAVKDNEEKIDFYYMISNEEDIPESVKKLTEIISKALGKKAPQPTLTKIIEDEDGLHGKEIEITLTD